MRGLTDVFYLPHQIHNFLTTHNFSYLKYTCASSIDLHKSWKGHLAGSKLDIFAWEKLRKIEKRSGGKVYYIWDELFSKRQN